MAARLCSVSGAVAGVFQNDRLRRWGNCLGTLITLILMINLILFLNFIKRKKIKAVICFLSSLFKTKIRLIIKISVISVPRQRP
ncbi:hypothetical protein, partial [Chitinophaga sp.]|uniref:hypothetical protein n=1 Tax=Chitinophaga sp. TaxID=1869181 RepID=UPI002D7FD5AB